MMQEKTDPVQGGGPSLLSDLEPTDWFWPYARTMSQKEIVKGYPDGSFKGHNPVTYDELAVMLARLLSEEYGFYKVIVADAGLKGVVWSRQARSLMKELDLMSGVMVKGDNQDMTRLDLVKVLYKTQKFLYE
jgi:hypothetical protein